MSLPPDQILRYTAFSSSPEGGNPAGVVLDAGGLTDEGMLSIAAEVGYSETAFLTHRDDGESSYNVRYFSPEAEVPFCGHATIAAAVVLAERDGPGEIVFHIRDGRVPVTTRRDGTGAVSASMTSVPPWVENLEQGDVDEALAALRWSRDELDPALPARIAYAGARHLILAAATHKRLSRLDYDFARLREFMLARELTTVDLVFAADERVYHARNPFPVGGVYEDPATGAAAAAFGAYLREVGRVSPPARITVIQGVEMGRPSRIDIDIPPGDEAITVTGMAVPIPS